MQLAENGAASVFHHAGTIKPARSQFSAKRPDFHVSTSQVAAKRALLGQLVRIKNRDWTKQQSGFRDLFALVHREHCAVVDIEYWYTTLTAFAAALCNLHA